MLFTPDLWLAVGLIWNTGGVSTSAQFFLPLWSCRNTTDLLLLNWRLWGLIERGSRTLWTEFDLRGRVQILDVLSLCKKKKKKKGPHHWGPGLWLQLDLNRLHCLNECMWFQISVTPSTTTAPPPPSGGGECASPGVLKLGSNSWLQQSYDSEGPWLVFKHRDWSQPL